MNPRVAARSKWDRTEALLRNRAFRDAYAARASFAAGVRDVVFPAKTGCVGSLRPSARLVRGDVAPRQADAI